MKFLIVFIVLVTNVWSLEVDEILTLRVIGLSESGKTILINRGIEDGLAVGDHAKFYVSTGVIARGVVIKTSPSRTVWSLYRLVNKGLIREEQVLKLKITPPVKITKDESKMLVDDDTSEIVAKDPRDLGIPLADGADDLANQIPAAKGQGGMNMVDTSFVSLLSKNREVFGMLHFASYSEQSSPDIQDAESYTRDVSQLYLKLGGEWYFKDEIKWYSRFSFLAHFAIDRKSVMAHDGDFVSENGSEFGFGVNFHPTKFPSKIHTPIPYLNYTLGIGSSNTTSTPGEGCVGSCETSVDASTFGHNLGIGFKYYTTQGIGARLEVAYHLRGDDYAEDENGIKWVKTRSGPRMLFGLSYRL
ncbi:MAG: hypothetical protein CME62_04715 [Halobacteriovoraceae bacterium]|nr:hypothetical protein [Halobacteriovoraceae bacterium]|tara:strand:+ start:15378 stop:16454 length:1077 start_codon:yes stop_codon:yes gene_type:complete